MPALTALLPTGDSAVGSWTTDSGGTTNLWQKIEETIASATDTNDYIKAPNDTDASDYKVALSDTPADFNSIKTLSWQVRYALSGAPPASNKDTYGISLRIMSGATVLAAADSSGTFQSVVSSTTISTTFSNSASTAFTYVNTSATKTQWDAAVLEIRQTYTQASSKDAHAVQISAVQCTGTYNPILSVANGSFAETAQTTLLKAARKLTVGNASFTATAQTTNLKFGHKLTVAVASIALAGGTISKVRTYRIAPVVSSFTLSGRAANITEAHLATERYGVFDLTGRNAGLMAARTLRMALASFAATGIPASLRINRKISPDVANCALAGQTVRPSIARYISIASGSIEADGQSVGLYRAMIVGAGSASFGLLGSAQLKIGRFLQASPASFDHNGILLLTRALRVTAVLAQYELDGEAADLVYTPIGSNIFDVDTGTFAFDGQAANLIESSLDYEPVLPLTLIINQGLHGIVVGSGRGALGLPERSQAIDIISAGRRQMLVGTGEQPITTTGGAHSLQIDEQS